MEQQCSSKTTRPSSRASDVPPVSSNMAVQKRRVKGLGGGGEEMQVVTLTPIGGNHAALSSCNPLMPQAFTYVLGACCVP